jgi:transposase-like protein
VDTNKQKAALALRNDTSRSVSEICQILGVCRNTYYRYVRSEISHSEKSDKDDKSQVPPPKEGGLSLDR